MRNSTRHGCANTQLLLCSAWTLTAEAEGLERERVLRKQLAQAKYAKEMVSGLA